MNMVHCKGGLYDIRRDPGEWYDMKDVHPEIVRELEAFADRMREKLVDSLEHNTGTECRPTGRITDQ